MSGSQQIRVDRMNPCLFQHWITEWTKQNKLPGQILAEEVQDTDEIPDDFPTESNMEINQDDDDEKMQRWCSARNTEGDLRLCRALFVQV